MDIFMIDGSNEKYGEDVNARLLWASVIFSERVAFGTVLGGLMDIYSVYDTIGEKAKVQMYMDMQRRNPQAGEEYVQSFEKFYKTIVRIRNDKRKKQQMIVLLKKNERIIRDCIADYKNWLGNMLVNHKVMELLPLSSPVTEKPILLWLINDNAADRKPEHTRIGLIANTTADPENAPLFPDMVNDYFSSEKIENINGKKISVDFISDFLFEFPAPETLSTSQVNLVRNEMSATAWKFFDEVDKATAEFQKMDFIPENFNAIKEKYTEKTAALKPLIQKTIDESEIFNTLKKENTKGGKYKVSLGFASFNTIVKINSELGMIDESTELYVKEMLSAQVDMNKTKAFLYLTVEE